MKIFTDGSLVGRTAAMSAPFDGEPGNSGYLQADAGHLTGMIIAAHRAGWRVAAHAIGDRAIDLALDAFATAADRYPRTDPRHRIEHFAAARPDQVARAAELGVIPVGQGRFASELGDGMLAAVGPERAGWLYRQRSLLDAGVVLSGSSDRPVASGAPLLGIHDMVNRRTATGAPFNDAEAVTAGRGPPRLHLGLRLRLQARARQGLDHPGQAGRLQPSSPKTPPPSPRTASPASRSPPPSSTASFATPLPDPTFLLDNGGDNLGGE